MTTVDEIVRLLEKGTCAHEKRADCDTCTKTTLAVAEVRRLATEAGAREHARCNADATDLERAAHVAIEAWLAGAAADRKGEWPTWEQMNAIEKKHSKSRLVPVLRRVLGLEHAPLNQILDTMRFKRWAAEPWRIEEGREVYRAAVALGTNVKEVAATAVRLVAERDALRAALQHVAKGNISPACGFAKRILDGEEITAAHRAEAAPWL